MKDINIKALSLADTSDFGILDFVALYLLKVNREDKKFSKIVSPYVEELKNIRDNQEIFMSYNKKATKYNILYSMSFTRFVLLFKKDKGTNYSIY